MISSYTLRHVLNNKPLIGKDLISRFSTDSINTTANTRVFKLMGFIGLGHMGSKMVANFNKESSSLLDNGILIFDRDAQAINKTIEISDYSNNVKPSRSVEDIANQCDVIFSMLPNDAVVDEISNSLINYSKGSGNKFIHISCSTISPSTSRRLKVLIYQL